MNESSVRFICCLMALLWLPISCSQPKARPITDVSQNDLKKGIVVDVRTPEEFLSGHLDGAINVDWRQPGFLQKMDTLPKSSTIYLYCKKGGRSARAAQLLDSAGYKVVDLLGGYDAWLKAQ